MVAKKKASPKRKSSPKKSPSKTPVIKLVDLSMYTQFEQDCINKAEAIVKEYKATAKKGTFAHVGHLVLESYIKAAKENPECGPFYADEKIKKQNLKAARIAANPKRRKSRRSRKSPKKSPMKGGCGDDTMMCGDDQMMCGEEWKCGDWNM